MTRHLPTVGLEGDSGQSSRSCLSTQKGQEFCTPQPAFRPLLTGVQTSSDRGMVSQVLPSLPSGVDVSCSSSSSCGPCHASSRSRRVSDRCVSVLAVTWFLPRLWDPRLHRKPLRAILGVKRDRTRDLDMFPRRVLWTYPNLNFQRKSHS